MADLDMEPFERQFDVERLDPLAMLRDLVDRVRDTAPGSDEVRLMEHDLAEAEARLRKEEDADAA